MIFPRDAQDIWQTSPVEHIRHVPGLGHRCPCIVCCLLMILASSSMKISGIWHVCLVYILCLRVVGHIIECEK